MRSLDDDDFSALDDGYQETSEEVKTATEKLEKEVKETLDQAGLGKLKGKRLYFNVYKNFILN